MLSELMILALSVAGAWGRSILALTLSINPTAQSRLKG